MYLFYFCIDRENTKEKKKNKRKRNKPRPQSDQLRARKLVKYYGRHEDKRPVRPDLTLDEVITALLARQKESKRDPVPRLSRGEKWQVAATAMKKESPAIRTSLSRAFRIGDADKYIDLVTNLNDWYIRCRAWRFDPEILQCNFSDELGKGSYGDVYAGTYEGMDVAVKCISFLPVMERIRKPKTETVLKEALSTWHERVGKEVQLQMLGSSDESCVDTVGCLFHSPVEV